MTEREFGAVFAVLAMQLRWTDADEMAVRSYYEALQSVSLEALKASAQQFAQEAGRRFFPTSAEWFEAAQHVTTEALRKALPPAREEPWRFDDEACFDTGWKPYECPGDERCGRRSRHVAHAYVRACPCRPTNKTFQRHQRFGSGA